MIDIPKLMALCEEDVGYVEGKNNDTKFGKWYGLNFNPWCAMAASKKYFDAGMIKTVAGKAKGYAACVEWLKHLIKNKQLVPVGQAQAGYPVFFDWNGDGIPDHVGICKSNNKRLKFLWVYEGNTSSGNRGSQNNGDGFYLRKRGYGDIMAVGKPKEQA